MGDKKLSLSVPVQFTKVDGDPHEGTFQKMKVFICSPGKNRNYSYISKEELNAATPSLAYVPVVGRIYEKVDKKTGEVTGYYFGGHDYEVDDNFEWRPTTVPYGVMTADEPWYETVHENGKDVEYLCGYCYLWTGRWPELREAAWDDTFWFSQSMEMSFKDFTIYEEDSNFVEFHGCRFDAICILGYDPDNAEYNTTPCFPSAGFVPVQEFSLGSDEFGHLMSELKAQLAESFEHKENSHQKGGNGLTKEVRDAIFAKFALSEDQVDFEITDSMDEQELTAKLEAFTAKSDDAETEEPEAAPAAEPASADGEFEAEAETNAAPTETEIVDEEKPEENSEAEFALFSMTYREKEEALEEAVSQLNSYTKNPDGSMASEVYCWVMDFDDTYVYYKANHYTPEGYEGKTFRCAYSFNEGKAELVGENEEVFQKWLTHDEIQQMDAKEAQLAELLKFKEEKEQAENSAKVESMLSEFGDLAGLEEFASIKEEIEKAEKPDIAQFKLRLFALRGMQVTPKTESAGKNTVKVGIDADSVSDDDSYGGLIERGRSRRRGK